MFWAHGRVATKMLAFDSSTKEGMCNFRGFIKTIERGGEHMEMIYFSIPLIELSGSNSRLSCFIVDEESPGFLICRGSMNKLTRDFTRYNNFFHEESNSPIRLDETNLE